MVKPKTKQVSELHRQLHDFVEMICAYGENPESWPLTQHEQVCFVRTVIYRARRIKTSEPFAREAVMIAAEDLRMGS